jgi:hypothetical protein
LHRNDREQKSANWLLKAAKDADLEIDDNMKAAISETLGDQAVSGKKRRRTGDDDGT